MGTMSASDAAPLPRDGEVFFDVRGESRTMRVSWYSGTGVAVFSIWQGGTCTGTFRLPIPELPRMVEALTRGPSGGTGPRPRSAAETVADGYAEAPGYGRAPAGYRDDGHRDDAYGDDEYADRPGGYEDDGYSDEYADALGGYRDEYAGAPEGYRDGGYGGEYAGSPAGYQEGLPGGYPGPGPGRGYASAGYAAGGRHEPSGPLPVGRWHEDDYDHQSGYGDAAPAAGDYADEADGYLPEDEGDDPLDDDYGEAEEGYLPSPPTETFSPITAGGSHSRPGGRRDHGYQPAEGPPTQSLAYQPGRPGPGEREYRAFRGRS
jgi:hypothetical protein